jgi:hypothetical protein
MGGACSTYGGWESYKQGFGVEPERPFETSRRGWGDNIIMDIQEVE